LVDDLNGSVAWQWLRNRRENPALFHPDNHRKHFMALSTTSLILLVVLLVLVLGAVPSWPHSRSWGYAPSGTLGTILVIVLIFALLGYL
jgi:hypothetical protein